MSNIDIKQLNDGLRQLQLNIIALKKYHHAKGLDLSAPYTRTTEDMMKIQFVNRLLGSLDDQT